MEEISPVIFWNVVLTLVIAPAIWMFRNLMAEVKRIDILLNRTREDYSTKQELAPNAPREVRYQVTPDPETADADDNFGFNELTSEFVDSQQWNPTTGQDEAV